MIARRQQKPTRTRIQKDRAKHMHAFLPDLTDQVKAIAMQGLSDDEMAALFAIDPGLIQKWKEFYPSFAKAIEEGRTHADAAVVLALFKRATGYSHPEEKVFVVDGDLLVHDTVKHYPPDYSSIKLWLTNRKKDQWKERTEHRIGGSSSNGDDNAPIGVRDETKLELMSSILNLIAAKPDKPASAK